MREKFIAKHMEVRIIQVDVILGRRFVSNVPRRGIRLLNVE